MSVRFSLRLPRGVPGRGGQMDSRSCPPLCGGKGQDENIFHNASVGVLGDGFINGSCERRGKRRVCCCQCCRGWKPPCRPNVHSNGEAPVPDGPDPNGESVILECFSVF